MPFYTAMNAMSKRTAFRTAKRVESLKVAMSESGIPAKTLDHSLLLATWNIREFDSTKFGQRTPESMIYLAEIVSAFDIVAVQEVRDDLTGLNALMDHLGSWWRYVLTDVTEGSRGNRERLAFLYDSRKVQFSGLAGEITLPRKEDTQFARTPFVVGFRCDWLRLMICTAHLYYGKDQAIEPTRLQEIKDLASFLKKRGEESMAFAPNIALLGDFNIFDPSHETFQAIVSQGFDVSTTLQSLPSSAYVSARHYDQIALHGSNFTDVNSMAAGVFDWTSVLYTDEEEKSYSADMGSDYQAKTTAAKRKTYYRQWRTHQVSDHLPMWIELPTDFSANWLASKQAPRRAPRERRQAAQLEQQVDMEHVL